MTERYITHHVTDHCAIQGPQSQVLAQVSRYGRRNVAKMYREVDALRKAIRAEGSPAIQEAWDAVEEHIDFAYRQPEAVKQSLTTGDLVSREAVVAPPLPDLALFDPADEEAMNWVFSNLHAIRRDNGNMDYTLKAVVRAYQAGKAAAPAVKVKPLAWKDGRVAYPYAYGAGARYQLGHDDDGWHAQIGCLPSPYIGGPYPSLEAAKAAAQADYESRILAALEGGAA